MILSGRLGEARALLEESLERTVAREVMHQRPLIVLWLGEAALAAGRLVEARERAEQALRLSRQNDERGHEAWALRLLGEVCARQDPAEAGRASALYGQALAVAEPLGMRPLVARSLLGMGLLGIPPAPGEPPFRALEVAAVMFRDMGMALWLAEARGALERSAATR